MAATISLAKVVKLDAGLSSFGTASLGASVLTGSDFTVSSGLLSISWSVILQASLVVSLFSLHRSESRTISPKHMRSLSLAFTFGTIGSILSAFVGSAISPGRNSWKMAIACLTGSFIGGVINFLEIANVIAKSAEDIGVLNLIAGVDILTMIAYFALMLSSRTMLSTLLSKEKEDPPKSYSISKGQYWKQGAGSGSLAQSVKALGLALGITTVSSHIQSKYPAIPGLSVPISTILAVTTPQGPSEGSGMLILCLFYAIIGLDCRIQKIAQVGLPA